jgi:hypothetical protein
MLQRLDEVPPPMEGESSNIKVVNSQATVFHKCLTQNLNLPSPNKRSPQVLDLETIHDDISKDVDFFTRIWIKTASNSTRAFDYQPDNQESNEDIGREIHSTFERH